MPNLINYLIDLFDCEPFELSKKISINQNELINHLQTNGKLTTLHLINNYQISCDEITQKESSKIKIKLNMTDVTLIDYYKINYDLMVNFPQLPAICVDLINLKHYYLIEYLYFHLNKQQKCHLLTTKLEPQQNLFLNNNFSTIKIKKENLFTRNNEHQIEQENLLLKTNKDYVEQQSNFLTTINGQQQIFLLNNCIKIKLEKTLKNELIKENSNNIDLNLNINTQNCSKTMLDINSIQKNYIKNELTEEFDKSLRNEKNFFNKKNIMNLKQIEIKKEYADETDLKPQFKDLKQEIEDYDELILMDEYIENDDKNLFLIKQELI